METPLGRSLRSTLAWLLAAGVVASTACGRARPQVVPGENPGIATAPRGLAESLGAAFDAYRSPGLEQRQFDPAHYWRTLLAVVDGAPDRFDVAPIGTSVEGRPLRRIDFGRGDTTVMLWSQMHGNESTASRALIDVLRFLLDNRRHPMVRRIERQLAVTIVPVVNPDGAARFVRRNALGIDLNRDARRLATPEARALKAVRDDIDADWGFNLHDQNVRTRLGNTGRDVRIALLAPPPGPGEVTDVNRAARRMCSLLASALEPIVDDQVARYDEGFNPRAFGDSMARWGTSVVLIESGGELGDPHKETLRRANYVALLVALDAIASGSWADVSPQRYLDLPLNTAWVYDLIVRGGSIVLPGREPVMADFAINYADTLSKTGGAIVEVGDLEEANALETIDATGLFFLPAAASLSQEGGPHLRIGDPADGLLARDVRGTEIEWRFGNELATQQR